MKTNTVWHHFYVKLKKKKIKLRNRQNGGSHGREKKKLGHVGQRVQMFNCKKN